jgi:hypothetical protein
MAELATPEMAPAGSGDTPEESEDQSHSLLAAIGAVSR